VPRAIREYRETHPLVALSLEESGTGELVAALLDERLDAAFVRSPIGAAEGIAVHSVLDEAMVAALPAGHVLADRTGAPPLGLAELAAETFILYRRPLGPGLYDAIIAACQRAGYSPIIGQEAPRMLATLSLVAAGLGVTLVPQSMRRLRVHGVAYRPLDSAAGLVAPLNLAYRHPDLNLIRAEVFTGLCDLVHQVLVKVNSYAFNPDRIAKLAERNLAHVISLADLFLERFRPVNPLTDAEFEGRCQLLFKDIDSTVDGDDSRTVLKKMLESIRAVLRTNVYVENRWGLAMRLDPALLSSTERPDLPYGVFFIHGREFNGFHVRFRDIARGGGLAAVWKQFAMVTAVGLGFFTYSVSLFRKSIAVTK
jgi:hypothetical protein